MKYHSEGRPPDGPLFLQLSEAWGYPISVLQNWQLSRRTPIAVQDNS